MNAQVPRRMSVGLVVVAVLALAQGVLGLQRAIEWIEIGSDLIHRGPLLLPFMGALAFGRAAVVVIIAALYGLLAWGLQARRSWARSLGLAVVLVNLALIAFDLVAGEPPGRAFLWAIAPVSICGYLLAPAGRRALEP